jgi:hypothetical protein
MGGGYDLAGGSSGSQLKFNHGGSRGAPITLESYPGQTATLTGGPVYVPHGSNYVTITHLDINTNGSNQVGVQIMGAYDDVTSNDITNLNTKYSCIIIGSDMGWGQATNTLVENNVVHQCGHNPGDPYEDHGVYVDNSLDATITNNIFWGMPYGWGVQLYPHAQGTQVTHNVIDNNNGQGVVFGGNTLSASSDNTVAYNIITNSSNQYNVQGYWGGAVGTGNAADNNCLYNGAAGNNPAASNIETPSVGFTASHNVIANPTYTNAAAHNYTLSPNSPCLRSLARKPGLFSPTLQLLRGGASTSVWTLRGRVTSHRVTHRRKRRHPADRHRRHRRQSRRR